MQGGATTRRRTALRRGGTAKQHDWGASDSDAPSLWHELWDSNYRWWLLRATAYEFFGTFILIYMQAASGETLNRLGLAASANDALGHGLAAGVAVYITVHVSGALLNPAMTLGFWFSRRLDLLTVFFFTLAQVAGSIAAAGLLRASIQSLTTGLGVPRLAVGISIGAGILIQATLAVFLFWVMGMMFLRSRYFWYRNRYRVHGNSPIRPALAALMAFVWNGGVEAAFVSTVGSGPNPVRWLGPAIVAGRYAGWYVSPALRGISF